ncbi:MAG: L,D-transpeptidase family protein [Saprospiraceae bacterium]|nr:L,D-transpeptidase family protein [Saprospiraceae bacterium]
MLKNLIIISGFILILVFVFKYGRSLYIPIVQKIKGKETVESIIHRIESSVWERLETNLGLAGYKMDYPHKIILVAFKEEQKLQVYSDDFNGKKLIKEYPFTAYSGRLGPKLKEGDKQIPEGIYKVEYLNPNSSYYLSIKINYPNKYDKSKSVLSSEAEMGNDIFIHGKSVTVGCIPIGDDGIEEVFVLTNKAFNYEVKVIISPRDFRKNKEYPQIDNIEWENELYDLISHELNMLPNYN